MTIILAIRAKITEIYQKYDFVVNTALKFALMFFALKKAAGIIGYNSTLSGTGAVIAFALVGAFLPTSLMVFLAVMYVFLQLLTASVLIAVTVMLVFMILYLFFLRFTPKEGAVVVATPLFISIGMPYAVPLFLGVFGGVLSIVPAACGVVAYFMLKAVTNNIVTIDQLKALKDQALTIYIDILDDLLNNPPMYVMMFVFAVVIIFICVIRSIRMDYSFEISILVGTVVMILASMIGSLIANTELEIVPMVINCLFCAVAAFVAMYFWRTLDYAGAERVQFEDERYYYYVTAVPKITPESPKRTVRRPKPAKDEPLSEDEEETEAIEAMESMLSGGKRPYAKPLTPALAKRLRRDVAPRYDDDDDEEDEVVIKGPRVHGIDRDRDWDRDRDEEDGAEITGPREQSGTKESVLEAVRSRFNKLKSVIPGIKGKANASRKDPSEEEPDEEEPDEEGATYFAQSEESSDDYAEAEESENKGDDDYE
ncbi:MAG: hypothetical protein J5643_03640 [Lachnospiraceae bacterium]|nr:hypothetical protein [Lachnospiraceae bacterium]